MEDKTLNAVPVTENLQNEKESNGLFVVLSVLKRFWVLILIFTIIGAGIGVGLALANDKTVYTQTKKVVCIAKIENKTMLTNISLTNRYIPTIKDQITTSLFIDKANEIYGEGDAISASAIGVTAGTNLILRISYSDVDPNVAEAKLNAFLQAAEILYGENNKTLRLVTGDEVSFRAIDNYPKLTSSNKFAAYTLIGVLGGLIVGAALAFLFYILDNTVTNKDELERLTGTNVIAFIDDVKE